MLRPVVEQHGNAMPMPKTVRSVHVAKPLHLARARRKIDLVSVPMIVPVGAGGCRKEQPRTIRFRRTRESLAYRSFLVVGDHALAPPPIHAATELTRLTNQNE